MASSYVRIEIAAFSVPRCGGNPLREIKGPLLVDTEAVLDPIFAQGDRLIAVHAEDHDRRC
jgi:dihydroorotase